MKLSLRLENIIEMIESAARSIDADKIVVADIGTDHALVPIETVSRGIADKAVASDINEGPIEIASKNIKEAGLSEKIETRVADGLLSIAVNEADIIVIAGMGGMLMKDILKNAPVIAKSARRLILSPQSDLAMFRKFLNENSYKIISERCVLDEGKYYFIMEVAYCDDYAYGLEETFDEKSLATRNELIERDLANYKEILTKVSDDSERKAEIEKLIADIEGVKKKDSASLATIEKPGRGKKGFIGKLVAFILGGVFAILVLLAVSYFNTRNVIEKPYSPYDDPDSEYYDEHEGDEEEEQEFDSTALWDEIQNKINLIDENLKAHYIFDIDKQAMVDGMIKGYVEALGDPYTIYYTASEYKTIMESTSGNFCGIGATVIKEENKEYCVISAVIEGGSADKAKIQKGDVLIRVDNKDLKGMDANQVVALVRGEENTKVKITVLRNKKKLDFNLIRKPVVDNVVESGMLEDGIGYIMLSQFTDNADEQVEKAIKDLSKQGMKKLIFDLRGNGGGTLDSALNIINFFIPKDKKVVTLKAKGGSNTTFKTDKKPICDVPMVVLVDGATASASELTSGTLQDYKRATIIGTKTFGKGIAQNTFPFQYADGTIAGALQITTAHYYLPLGRCIHGQGITPDVLIKYVRSDTQDNQLDKAIEIIKSK